MIKHYISLTKPGIIFGNAITAAAGFALASKGLFDWTLFLTALFGLSCVIGSACIFNNYIDRLADQKMARTQKRAFAQGMISISNALIFASVLCFLGCMVLFLFTNILTACIAIAGFCIYVFVYSFFKYKTMYATLIGSFAGAVPPIVGYCAVQSRFDGCALILFTMTALWQMPHFFAIALYRLADYSAASIPVLPVKKGIYATKIQMLIFIVAFIVCALFLTLFHYASLAYLIIATTLGFVWLVSAIQGFKCSNDHFWARKMFVISLVVITTLSLTISFDTFLIEPSKNLISFLL